ncbi:immunoglobulin A1 protease [Streptococcus pneumoniae]|nr:immunoglobulin A1 protease [Streptococcus pneumoniae]
MLLQYRGYEIGGLVGKLSGSLASIEKSIASKEAKYNTLIDNVHSDGIIAGERGIGGLVSKVDNSRISNSSFTGRITNTYDTTALT